MIDFGVLKEKIGGWIDEYWDHGFIVYVKDEEVISAITATQTKAHFLDENPTAENMAEYLLRKVCPDVLHGTGVEVFKVALWETENCFAEATL